MGHLISLRFIYLRDEGGSYYLPINVQDNCSLFIQRAPPFSSALHHKAVRVPGGRFHYAKTWCLVVIEFWLIENKRLLFCKPVWIVKCPVLFMLFMRPGKTSASSGFRIYLMTGVGSGTLRTPLLSGCIKYQPFEALWCDFKCTYFLHSLCW